MAPNVNNWARAAQVVTSQNTAIRKKLADDKPRYDRIGQASVQAAAKNAVNVAENNASTADTAIQAEALMRKTKIGIDEDKKIRGIKKQAKMTGMLAGGAALIGYGAMNLNKEEEPNEVANSLQSLIAKNQARMKNIQGELDAVRSMTFKGAPTSNNSNSTSDSTSSSTPISGGSSRPISSAQFDSKKGNYSVADMTRLAEEAGFTPEQARVMGAIGMAESGGRARIDTSQTIDPGKKNEYSIGLFQVNAQAHGDKLAKLGYSEDDLRDPRKAAQVAKMVYDEVGSFKPWSVYKSGDYAQYLPK